MYKQWDLDLEILDYLELIGSTVKVSHHLNISQSSCSRRYRRFSDECGLDFDRDGNQYRALKNLSVLADLRSAAQGIRVRKGQLRYINGWQMGLSSLESTIKTGRVLPKRPLDTYKVLSLLEQRIADIAVIGILECKNLVDIDFERMRLKKIQMGSNLLCVPFCQWQYKLVTSSDHQLAQLPKIATEELEHHKSLRLPIGTAPTLMIALSQHNLGNCYYYSDEYDSKYWFNFCSQEGGITYAPPFNCYELERKGLFKTIDYSLDITECLAVVGHKYVFNHPAFQPIFKLLHADLVQVISSSSNMVRLLH